MVSLRVLVVGERAVLPVPLELRQRYYEQLTDPLADAKWSVCSDGALDELDALLQWNQ
jgi:hypothetical protein